MPWRISEKSGREISGTVTRRRRVRSIRRFFAVAFGAYPRRSTAAMTRRRVAGATTAAFDSTRETVAVDTPALLATALILATMGKLSWGLGAGDWGLGLGTRIL